MRVSHGHKELGTLGVMEHENLFTLAGITHLDTAKACHTMLGMNDDVALTQVAHDIARLAQHFGFIEFRAAHAADVLMTAKNFRACQHRQPGRRHGEAAIQQAQFCFERGGQAALKLREALTLRLVMEEDDGAPAGFVPFADLSGEVLPPCLVQNKVRGIKHPQRIFMNGR